MIDLKRHPGARYLKYRCGGFTYRSKKFFTVSGIDQKKHIGSYKPEPINYKNRGRLFVICLNQSSDRTKKRYPQEKTRAKLSQVAREGAIASSQRVASRMPRKR